MSWDRVSFEGLRWSGLAAALWGATLATGARAGDTTVWPPTVVTNDVVNGSVTAWDDLGHELAVDGSWLALGASPVDGATWMVFLYEQVASAWTQRQILSFADDFNTTLPHWKTLVLEGDTLSVLVDDEAHVYRLALGTWSLEQVLTPADAGGGSFFDQALSGDTLAYAGTGNPGTVHLFDRSGSVWTHTTNVQTSYYNASVALDGDTLFAATLSGLDTFERIGGNWVSTGPLTGTPLGSIESVVIEGDRAVLTDHHSAYRGWGSAGVAYAYERVNGDWTLMQTLTAASPGVGDHFGTYMHFAGDTLAVRSNPSPGQDTLHVFRHDGVQWNLAYEELRNIELCGVANDQVFVGTRTAPAAVDVYEEQTGSWAVVESVEAFLYQPGGDFGSSLDVAGTRMIVGAPQAGFHPPDSLVQPTGLAVTYAFDGTSWQFEQILSAFDAAPGHVFGAAVAIDGDYAVVGAPGHPSVLGRGVAYVYHHDGAQWQFEALLDDFGAAGFGFGRAIDMDGQRLVIGAPDTAGPGAAFTFRLSLQTGTWGPAELLVSPQTAVGDRFGHAVAVDRSHLAVSARAALVATYLDTPQGWIPEDVLLAPPPYAPGGWGWALDIDEANLVVGAPYATPATLSGMIVLYERLLDGSWVERAQLFNPASANKQEHLGFAVSIEGDLILGSINSDFTGAQPNVDKGFWVFQRAGAGWTSQALQGQELYEASPQLHGSQVFAADRNDPGAIRVYDLDHQPASFCWGDGNEGPCPCGNAGLAGEGCATSTGAGAVLDNMGTTSLAADDLVITASQLPANKPGLFFAGTLPIGATLGDGLLCVIPQYRGLPRFSGAGGTFSQASLGTTLGASPGDVWYVQTWFRDPAGPCASGFATSNGLIVTFLP